MNPSHLLEHFDRISEASDAIPKLRKLVLELAVRGKLVEQNAADQPAQELLKDIRATKSATIRSGQSRNSRVSPVAVDPGVEPPFPIPAQWSWCRLSDLGAIIGGGTPPSGDLDNFTSPGDGTPWVTPADLGRQKGLYLSRGARDLTPRGLRESSATLMPIGSVLFTSRAPIGYTAIAANDVSTNQGFKSVVPYLMECNRYIEVYLRAFTKRIEALASGTTFREVSGRIVAALSVPLPPLAGQRRIVAKVDELMALCDRLESLQSECKSRRDRLVTSSLSRLNQPSDDASFAEAAHFHFKHFNRLTTAPDQLARFRRTVINLAVRGRLVPQHSRDEPASVLVERIQVAKKLLADQGVLRTEKPLPAVPSDSAPFPVPTNWVWTRIGSCSLRTDYGTSVKSDSSIDGVPVLKMGDLQDGSIELGGQKKVRRNIKDLPSLFLKRFDLLYNRTNSAELVGKTGIYLGDDDAYTFASYLIRIRFLQELTNARYVNMAMNASYFRQTQILPELTQQCGQANVNGTKLRAMAIPLPPLDEQHRIVAKVDELLALCDQIEEQFAIADSRQRHLIEVMLDQALDANLSQAEDRASTVIPFSGPGGSPSWREAPSTLVPRATVAVPHLGTIAAGVLTVADQAIQDWFHIPTTMVKVVDDAWCVLRVSGDSMNLAAIDERKIESGDFLLVRRQDTPEVGKIVVAEFEGEAVLKRFVRTARGAVLKAESTGSYSDIAVEPGFRIQGVVRANLKSGSEFERTDEKEA